MAPGTEMAAPDAAHGEGNARLLLGIALLIAVAAGSNGLTSPWADGLRGEVESTYTSRFVENGLAYGVWRTHGLPTGVEVVDGVPAFSPYLRHPPLQYLLSTGAAALFGSTPTVLRLVALLLYLPALPALFALCRRQLGAPGAGWAALLFAATPLAGYFGPMASHHGLGSMIAAGLWTMVAFDRFLATGSRRAYAATTVLFFITTQFDFLGHLWGIALFAQACAASRRRHAIAAVLALLPVALLSVLLVALHAGTVIGGVSSWLRALPGLFHEQYGVPITIDQVGEVTRVVLFDYGAVWLVVLAIAGTIRCVAVRQPWHRQTLALAVAAAVPGAIICMVSLPHLVLHAFWPLPLFPGLAILAAVPAAECARVAPRESPATRRGRRSITAATALVCIVGTVSTHLQIDAARLADPEFPVLVREAEDLVRDCYITLTNRNVPMRHYLFGQLVFGKVHERQELDSLLRYAPKGREVGFVLDASTADPDLVAALRERSAVQHTAHFEVYRLRV